MISFMAIIISVLTKSWSVRFNCSFESLFIDSRDLCPFSVFMKCFSFPTFFVLLAFTLIFKNIYPSFRPKVFFYNLSKGESARQHFNNVPVPFSSIHLHTYTLFFSLLTGFRSPLFSFDSHF